jgi:sugar/nucleoside kinase (ribokinase family)
VLEMEDLEKRLLKNLVSKKVVLMPDFNLDRLVYWRQGVDALARELSAVAARKGGNIYVDQSIVPGGCAAKTSWVLGLFGLRPAFLARTSPLGLKLLEYYFEGRADLSMVLADGEMALTVALETSEGNLMVTSPGSNRDFDWEAVKGHASLLKEADVVGIFSWNHIEKGTLLVQKVYSVAGGLKFLDTGDPTLKSREAAQELLSSVRPDVWSMNENEVKYFCSFFSVASEPRKAADILWQHGIRVVLHTGSYSYSPEGVMVPSFNVDVKRATGAGDCWNAGYILARISGFATEECLTLANATGACWVAGQDVNLANITSLLGQKSPR